MKCRVRFKSLSMADAPGLSAEKWNDFLKTRYDLGLKEFSSENTVMPKSTIQFAEKHLPDFQCMITISSRAMGLFLLILGALFEFSKMPYVVALLLGSGCVECKCLPAACNFATLCLTKSFVYL